MNKPEFPSLYQVNTRVWMTELSIKLGRQATLDDIPDSALDHFKEMGFDWIWFLSVWHDRQNRPAGFTAECRLEKRISGYLARSERRRY